MTISPPAAEIPDARRKPLPVFLGVLLLLVIGTRLPFLWNGYGADADAWLVANTSLHVWETGEYQPSRLPGYPLHEIFSAPLVRFGGAFLSNAGTLVMLLASILVMHRIASHFGRFPRLLVISFAFAPVVWQNSTVTLDYLWSLFFLLMSFSDALNKRYLAAGIFLGLAAGFRLSAMAGLVPIICLLYCTDKKVLPTVYFSIAAFLTAAAAYMPLVMLFGIDGWVAATRLEMSDVHPDSIMRLLAFGYRMVYFAGPVTSAIVVYLFWKKRQHIVTAVRRFDPLVVSSIAGIFVFSVLFLWLPLERAYLLPLLPFVLILIDRFFSRREFVTTAFFLIVSGLVTVDVIDADDRRKASISVHSGMVIQEWLNRRFLLDERDRIAGLPLAGPAVVITGSGPSFWFNNRYLEPVPPEEIPFIPSVQLSGIHQKIVRQKANQKILYIPYLTRAEIDSFLSISYTVHVVAAVKAHVESVTGEPLNERGIIFH